MADIIGWLLFIAAAAVVVILIGGTVYLIHDMFRQNRRRK